MESKFKVGDRVYQAQGNHCKKAWILEIDYSDRSMLLQIDGRDYPIWQLMSSEYWIGQKKSISEDIQSLKDKYPQFNITVSVEDKV